VTSAHGTPIAARPASSGPAPGCSGSPRAKISAAISATSQRATSSRLAGLDAIGVPCALVTASSRAIMEAVLKVTALSFSVTVCGEDVRRGKPDPEPYLLAAARLGVPAAGCVVLEDSPTGIAAARAAGCPVIAVPSVPLPPGSGLIAVKSLDDVGFDLLERVVTGKSEGCDRAVTEKF
jgi:beta-phosphoglucomutase-like phosphatase (HAD superfamily)